MILNFLKWYKRNFGYVYLRNAAQPDVLWRFRARHGRVAFEWCGGPFYCRLADNGDVVNVHDKSMSGYGKPYPGWTWQYFYKVGFPLENIRTGGHWS